MTNSSLSFALKIAFPAVLLALLAGCGPRTAADAARQGRELLDAGDLRKAEALFAKGAELDAANVDVQVGLALLKLRAGDLDAARASIARAEALAPGDSDVRLLGAQIAWHQSDYTQAERLFRGVAEDAALTPEIRSQGYAGLGIVEKTCSEHDLARVAFLRAIRLNRRNASAWYHLGLLYRDSPFGYVEAALDQFEIFIRLDEIASPRVQTTQRVIIPGLRETIARAMTDRPGVAARNSEACMKLLEKAAASRKKGANKTACGLYRDALKADVLSYPAALGLAETLLKTDTSAAGRKKALDAYHEACTLRPSAISAFIAGGRLAENLGLYAQAREFYSRAVAANPASLDALDGLIRAVRKTGGGERIVRAYQDYRDTLPKTRKR